MKVIPDVFYPSSTLHLFWACFIFSRGVFSHFLCRTDSRTTISSLLASTTMTSNSPAMASSVASNLSPSAEPQMTHINTPRVPLHTPYPSSCLRCCPFLHSRVLSTPYACCSHASAHVSRSVPGAAVPCPFRMVPVFPAVSWSSLCLPLCPLGAW